jgi:hypothetical protein
VNWIQVSRDHFHCLPLYYRLLETPEIFFERIDYLVNQSTQTTRTLCGGIWHFEEFMGLAVSYGGFVYERKRMDVRHCLPTLQVPGT